MTTEPRYNMRHKAKRYRRYLLDAPAHYESIISKYGMPPKAHPPSLPEDIIDRVITKMTPRKWNKS